MNTLQNIAIGALGYVLATGTIDLGVRTYNMVQDHAHRYEMPAEEFREKASLNPYKHEGLHGNGLSLITAVAGASIAINATSKKREY
ncbi:MAG: hypothetical protein WCK90_00075 [archaeon]